MTTHYTNLEVTLNGLTFIVSGNHSKGRPADDMNPEEYEEFEVTRLAVKGQPEADPDAILDSMRGSLRIVAYGSILGNPPKKPRISFADGHEQLNDRLLTIMDDN